MFSCPLFSPGFRFCFLVDADPCYKASALRKNRAIQRHTIICFRIIVGKISQSRINLLEKLLQSNAKFNIVQLGLWQLAISIYAASIP